MKKIELKNRYGDIILITKDDNKDYYVLHTKNISYISEHYNTDMSLAAIDPEGLHVIHVGDMVDTTNDRIIKINACKQRKYKLYV